MTEKKSSLKEIRSKTGLTQKEFSNHYHIPLQTLKQWESSPDSSSFRTPPEYVVYMTGRLVDIDFGITLPDRISRVDNLFQAAKESRTHASLWMRYLRKEVEDDRIRLTPDQVDALLDGDQLSMFQKISLKRAVLQGTPTNRAVCRLNKKTDTRMIRELMEKHAHA